MHFCFTGQYTPQALNNMMENPTTSRYEAAKKLIEAAGGKLISFYGTPADGPGAMAIFDVPDPGAAAACHQPYVIPGRPASASLRPRRVRYTFHGVRETSA